LAWKRNLWFNQRMRWIFISPHLDDAILSAGGLIFERARAGDAVEIWTLACGFPPDGESSPLAQTLHTQWGFRSAEDAIRSRRAEDQRAAAIVDASVHHFDFLDCIYRRDAAGDWLYPQNTFIPLHRDDENLPALMTTALAERLQSDDMVLCPLALGGHVDHVIVRRAVENLKHPPLYYADFPYLLTDPALKAAGQMQPQRQSITLKGLAAWQKSASSYASQIAMEFETPWKMRWQIAVYWQRGISLWK
jgi:LmbE family N-acetylglucosaminyl deacetylase